MFFKKLCLYLSLASMLLCAGRRARLTSSNPGIKRSDVEIFREYLRSLPNISEDDRRYEQSTLRRSLTEDPVETERIIRENKDLIHADPSKKIGISIDFLYSILLLTGLADKETFLDGAFHFHLNGPYYSLIEGFWAWDDLKTWSAEDFIKALPYYLFGSDNIKLYKKKKIPQSRLKIFVTITAEYIIKMEFYSLNDDIPRIVGDLLSDNPYDVKTALPKSLAADGILKFSSSGDQKIELHEDLTKKVEGFLSRDYSVIDGITDYLEKAKEEGSKEERSVKANKFDIWSKAVEEKKNLIKSSKQARETKLKPQ